MFAEMQQYITVTRRYKISHVFKIVTLLDILLYAELTRWYWR